jgi:hypothetical protein
MKLNLISRTSQFPYFKMRSRVRLNRNILIGSFILFLIAESTELCAGIDCEKDPVSGGCSMSIETVYGRLVDKNTGKPIQDAIVMGYWPSTLTQLLRGKVTVGVARLAETTTDQNGFFQIPACQPPECEIELTAPGGHIKYATRWPTFAPYQPDILFFKDGYYPKGLSNPPGETEFNPDIASHRQWSWAWNGEIIELEPVTSTNDPRLKANYTISPRLYLNDSCNWMKVPRTLMFKADQIIRNPESHEQDKQNPATYLLSHFIENNNNCHPQPEQFLQQYQH